jgi:serine protease Do
MSVADGAPVERAGIFVGDVLIEANGQPLRKPTDLLDALSSLREGEQLQLKLLRGGAVKSVSVTPADRGARE